MSIINNLSSFFHRSANPENTGVSYLTNIPIALLSLALGHTSVMPGVDWHSTITTQGVQERISTEAGKASGQQLAVYVYKKKIIAEMDTVFLKGKVYVDNSNYILLSHLLNLKSNVAKSLVNKWIMVPKSYPQYNNFITGLTVQSVMHQLQMNGKVVRLRYTNFNHQKAIPLQGIVPGIGVSQIVYISNTKSPLPLGVVDKQGSNSSTTYFGPWKAPKVSAPAHFVVYSSHIK